MKLAYFSPLGPQRSGISDYSEELLPHLAAGAEITLFVDGFYPSNRALSSRFEVCDYRRQRSSLRELERFDAVVYHMGNDPRYHAGIYDVMQQQSGVVVFHDFVLQDFFLGLARQRGDLSIYLNEVAACHGDAARNEAAKSINWSGVTLRRLADPVIAPMRALSHNPLVAPFFKLARRAMPSIVSHPIDFPLNCRLAQTAEAIIVHSDWSRTRLETIAPRVPVRHIQHHITSRAAAGSTRPARKQHDPVRLASFGFITPDKGIERAMRTLAALRDRYDFRYTLVGETSSLFNVRDLVKRYGLEDRVEVTGYVTLEEFERHISETDIALNLRERTIGETSGSLCRVMAAGVTAIVSNAGWFAELPGDAVVKVDKNEYTDELLRASLEKLIIDSELRERIGANARSHVLAHHRIEQSAERYLSFIREVADQRKSLKVRNSD